MKEKIKAFYVANKDVADPILFTVAMFYLFCFLLVFPSWWFIIATSVVVLAALVGGIVWTVNMFQKRPKANRRSW
jgi:hypothetical protein